MNCKEFEKKTPDYLAGELDPAALQEYEAHIAGCGVCREEVEELKKIWLSYSELPEEIPSRDLRKKFDIMIETFNTGLESGRNESGAWQKLNDWISIFWPKQPALQFALVLFICLASLFTGFTANEMKGSHVSEIAQMRDEVQTLNQLVVLTLLQQNSPSERLKGLNRINYLENPDEAIINELFSMISSDPNMNVRLASIDILNDLPNLDYFRTKLLSTLIEQSSPLVQMGIIELLITAREKRAKNVFREMLKNHNLDTAVKERLELGIAQLESTIL